MVNFQQGVAKRRLLQITSASMLAYGRRLTPLIVNHIAEQTFWEFYTMKSSISTPVKLASLVMSFIASSALAQGKTTLVVSSDAPCKLSIDGKPMANLS